MTLPDPESPPTPSCPCQGRLDVPSPWSAGFHDGSHGHRRGTSDYYAEHEEGPEDARTYGDAYDYGAEIRRNAGLHNPLEPRMQLPDPETCRRLARDVAPRWIWFAGMLTTHYGRVQMDRGVPSVFRAVWGTSIPVPYDALPDLADPLTAAGALLVFKAVYADSTAFASRGHAEALGDARDWVAWARLDPDEPDAYDGVGFGPTELEALIAAILAAPEKP